MIKIRYFLFTNNYMLNFEPLIFLNYKSVIKKSKDFFLKKKTYGFRYVFNSEKMEGD